MQKTHPTGKPKRPFKPKRRPPFNKIRPGADPRLRTVFSTIGTPEKMPFRPDPFQLEALSAIKTSDCLVTAPTGAGKTWIAIEAIRHIRDQGGSAWYASPLKALTNSKYIEFSEVFGPENVGILTGDRKENPDAPIIVGTTEILRNQLYDAMHEGEDLSTDFVILDEAHYLGDEDRGVVWEEVMIYLPPRIPLLMLSATVGNAGQIAAWLSAIRERECVVVAETRRPVPLFPLFFHPSGTLMPLMAGGNTGKRLYKKVNDCITGKRPPALARPGRLPPFGEILNVLRKYRLLPAIFFLKSRADCDNALDLCPQNRITDPERQERIQARIAEFAEQAPRIAGQGQIWHLENLAVGAHHSGQLPIWKMLVESLMTDGLLDAVFATSTVAAGVNFPARTIVFLNSDRFNGVDFMPLTPTEFHQMTGRAGRRGMDKIGFAAAIPGKYMDIRCVGKLVNAQAADVLSQIRINFSMTLNLLLSHNPKQIEAMLRRSFAAYLMGKKKRKKQDGAPLASGNENLREDFRRHFQFLMDIGYVSEDGTLTEDGVWASQLRVDQPLLIAEGFRKRLFPVGDPRMLAAIITSFVNEREVNDRLDKEVVPNQLTKHFKKITKGLAPFQTLMFEQGFGIRPLYLRPALTMFLWASGLYPWEEVLRISELAEGDLAMLVLRTADNLRHIVALRQVFPKASEAASKALEMILRDPVVTLLG
ncbi:ATP-dependent DNA helicase [Desulfonema ishimotonii]|uniref:ATP-dependent DNA helicase n=1 Tax=Desulfonema ishimotonii TaxID=45657 RepID=A0A401FQ48_9BACT|nr:DEAD/DEAH box helicase [Desulfonema ishimotonii]GBC59116.1 ATP-dependent DNA helicase [Desulfonema ishimotonii]